MDLLNAIAVLSLLLLAIISFTLFFRENEKKHKCIKTLIVLGSGGHTGEMMKIVSNLQKEIYHPRFYFISATDNMSGEKVLNLEKNCMKNTDYFINYVSRSREVGEPLFSSIISVLNTFWSCWLLVFKIKPNLILCNGPGTCVPICVCAFIFTCLKFFSPKIVFIESICRVKTLSLTGKFMYYISDEFFVQWKCLTLRYPKSKYIGRLI